MEPAILTIDGPAGSGKSTIAENLARRHGFLHINSGLLYRAVGLLALDRGHALSAASEGSDELGKLASTVQFSFRLSEEGGLSEGGNTGLFVEGKPVGVELLSEEAGEAASEIAVCASVREVLNSVQRQAAFSFTGKAVVIEGRDAGTEVFPNAFRKYFVTASLAERAKRIGRRSEEAEAAHVVSDQGKLESGLAKRDHRDSARAVSPLGVAKGAQVIETDNLSVEEVLALIERDLEGVI